MAGRATTRRLAAAAASLVPAKSGMRTTIAALTRTPVRHSAFLARHSMPLPRPVAASVLSRASAPVKVQTRSMSAFTSEQLAEVKDLVRAEVLAELRAGGLTQEQLDLVKVTVRTEMLPVQEKVLASNATLSTDFAAFKLHEVERFAKVESMQNEGLVRVGTVSWRVCIGVLSVTVFILFEFYDIVKVGWQANVIQTARDYIDQKAQEIQDDLTRKIKSLLDHELQLLCAKHSLLKGQQPKAANDSDAPDAYKK